ncbi:hypothetical protein [Hymenobacter cheonanensis]|uniref:hypothetical protein n=1 Tax=Hymenobacter sp. CA2-7 TaxID=3063993 RepID=UPI002713A211|nr:hypothetical protein [Hymenobacter sp. CA2-7]MDO7888288.1 hypothetical protein [Hymenobacter sp. CA2-7]
MKVATAPNVARGELNITIDGQAYPIRFSLAVLHDYTRATGHSITQIGEQLNKDLLGTIGQLLASAVKRYVPAEKLRPGFDIGDALDLTQTMSAEESGELAEAVWAAIRVDENPFVTALIAKAPKPESAPNENGASTSTSLSAS